MTEKTFGGDKLGISELAARGEILFAGNPKSAI
jgi:hypothetical protein